MESNLMGRKLNQISLLFMNLGMTGGIFLVYNTLSIPAFLECNYPISNFFILALGTTLSFNILSAFLLGRTWLKRTQMSLIGLAGLGLLAYWLGSYRYSPLGIFGGNSLHGFQITRLGHVNEFITSGDIILLRAGQPVNITVIADYPKLSCSWSSLNGGNWDESDSCDTTYAAPAAEYDILTVRLKSGCNLSTIRGQIKISLFP